jgi:hypothetical protein
MSRKIYIRKDPGRPSQAYGGETTNKGTYPFEEYCKGNINN